METKNDSPRKDAVSLEDTALDEVVGGLTLAAGVPVGSEGVEKTCDKAPSKGRLRSSERIRARNNEEKIPRNVQEKVFFKEIIKNSEEKAII